MHLGGSPCGPGSCSGFRTNALKSRQPCCDRRGSVTTASSHSPCHPRKFLCNSSSSDSALEVDAVCVWSPSTADPFSMERAGVVATLGPHMRTTLGPHCLGNHRLGGTCASRRPEPLVSVVSECAESGFEASVESVRLLSTALSSGRVSTCSCRSPVHVAAQGFSKSCFHDGQLCAGVFCGTRMVSSLRSAPCGSHRPIVEMLLSASPVMRQPACTGCRCCAPRPDYPS